MNFIGRNWEQIYNQALTANVEAPKSKFMFIIGEITIPILVETPYLLALATTSLSQTWRYAGYFRQKIQLGVGARVEQIYLAKTHRLDLRKLTFFQLETPVGTYSLTFQPPEYMQKMDLQIWRYVSE